MNVQGIFLKILIDCDTIPFSSRSSYPCDHHDHQYCGTSLLTQLPPGVNDPNITLPCVYINIRYNQPLEIEGVFVILCRIYIMHNDRLNKSNVNVHPLVSLPPITSPIPKLPHLLVSRGTLNVIQAW